MRRKSENSETNSPKDKKTTPKVMAMLFFSFLNKAVNEWLENKENIQLIKSSKKRVDLSRELGAACMFLTVARCEGVLGPMKSEKETLDELHEIYYRSKTLNLKSEEKIEQKRSKERALTISRYMEYSDKIPEGNRTSPWGLNLMSRLLAERLHEQREDKSLLRGSLNLFLSKYMVVLSVIIGQSELAEDKDT